MQDGKGSEAVSRPSNEDVVRWYPRLFRTALRMTGRAERAADLTQEALYKALRSWDRFDGRAKASVWLHRILVNCVRDWARRQSLRNAETLNPWALADQDVPEADDRLHQKEQLAYMRQAIRSLPEVLRTAFIATVLDGYTYRETSELLSVPIGTVASRVHEARKQVRAAMRRRFPEA